MSEFEQGEQSPSNNELSSEEVSSQDPNAPAYLDLDSAQGFKYGGKEYSIQELQNGWLRHGDYTKKTQELAEQRKSWENYSKALLDDLDAVKKNPTLVDEFKRVYPKEFHGALERVLRQSGSQQQQANNQTIDPRLEERLNRTEQYIESMELNAINKELDVKFNELAQKYPYADEEACITRAQYLLDQKAQRGDNSNLTDKEFEGIWKSVHEKTLGLFNKQKSNEYNGQKQANLRGKDVASGGTIPGQGPAKPRSIKEASELLMKSFDNG